MKPPRPWWLRMFFADKARTDGIIFETRAALQKLDHALSRAQAVVDREERGRG